MQRLHEQCDKGDDEWDFDEIDGFDELEYVYNYVDFARLC